MTVYVLTNEFHHESERPIGVYSSLEGAKRAAEHYEGAPLPDWTDDGVHAAVCDKEWQSWNVYRVELDAEAVAP